MVSPNFNYKQVIVIRRDLEEMSVGKAIAQACHASEEAVHLAEIKNQQIVDEWRAEGFRKIVCQVYSIEDMQTIYDKAKEVGLPVFWVSDFGCTELPPNTATAIAIGPDLNKNVNKVTKDLEKFGD